MVVKKSLISIPPWIILGAVMVLMPIFAFMTIEIIHRQKENTTKLIVEKAFILKTLESTSGNKSEAARRLGITRKTFIKSLKSTGLFLNNHPPVKDAGHRRGLYIFLDVGVLTNDRPKGSFPKNHPSKFLNSISDFLII